MGGNDTISEFMTSIQFFWVAPEGGRIIISSTVVLVSDSQTLDQLF